jgi:hypothetical protein
VSYHGHGTPNPRSGLTALIVVPGPATDSAVAEITAVMSRLVLGLMTVISTPRYL